MSASPTHQEATVVQRQRWPGFDIEGYTLAVWTHFGLEADDTKTEGLGCRDLSDCAKNQYQERW